MGINMLRLRRVMEDLDMYKSCIVIYGEKGILNVTSEIQESVKVLTNFTV